MFTQTTPPQVAQTFYKTEGKKKKKKKITAFWEMRTNFSLRPAAKRQTLVFQVTSQFRFHAWGRKGKKKKGKMYPAAPALDPDDTLSPFARRCYQKRKEGKRGESHHGFLFLCFCCSAAFRSFGKNCAPPLPLRRKGKKGEKMIGPWLDQPLTLLDYVPQRRPGKGPLNIVL